MGILNLFFPKPKIVTPMYSTPNFNMDDLPFGEPITGGAQWLLTMENNGTGFIDGCETDGAYDAETWTELVDKGYLIEVNISWYQIMKQPPK